MSNGRRPTALLSQLRELWERAEAIEDLEEMVATAAQQDGSPLNTDPGDITVYFENSLVGP
jgi:hypothetical protein